MTDNTVTTEVPLVSLGLPVYNGEQYLRQTLESLLAQDYANFEVIISDNGSTDATPTICHEFASRDSRIQYLRRPTNVGAIKNWNAVVASAKGKYLMWTPDHDLWHPQCISRCARMLEQDPSLVLCYPGAQWIDINGNVIENIPPRLNTAGIDKLARLHVVMWGLENCYPVHGMWRLSALKRSALFTDTVGPDAVLLVEMSLLGGFANVPEPLFYLRRMPYEGDMDKFLERLYKRAGNPWSAVRFYAEYIFSYAAAVNRQTRSIAGKAVVIPAALFCALTRYHWLLRGLWAAGRRNRHHRPSHAAMASRQETGTARFDTTAEDRAAADGATR